jgi:protein disulfide-isomerase-like protein
MFALRILSTLLLVRFAYAGHNDMFSCRKGKCPVTEITDSNFDIELASPAFVMFYAPWCGHCKQLAPVLKKAAKSLEQSGVKIAAVDVEPNPGVQGKFPDIRGFPTLKFLPSSNPKKAIDYAGGRDEQSIIEFAKQQAKKHGVVLGEPVVNKKFSELYSFMGRSAIENKPVLLVIGNDNDIPPWIGKLASDLRKNNNDKNNKENNSPESKTKELLKEASRVTKLDTVKDGIGSLLELIQTSESSSSLLPPQVSVAYANDQETIDAFQLNNDQDLPMIILASVDRKTASGSYIIYPNDKNNVSLKKPDKRGKYNLNPITDYIKTILPSAIQGPNIMKSSLSSSDSDYSVLTLPEFPKPPNVLAAEERERKKKEKENSINEIINQDTLNKYCYDLSGKTCALLFMKGGAQLASLNNDIMNMVKKFTKDGMSFASIDIDNEIYKSFLQNEFQLNDFIINNESDEGILAVVKGGKRPRVTAVSGEASNMISHLDNIAGGSASFNKLKNGLPKWPSSDDDQENGVEEEL